jgi:hypothetical protein
MTPPNGHLGADVFWVVHEIDDDADEDTEGRYRFNVTKIRGPSIRTFKRASHKPQWVR